MKKTILQIAKYYYPVEGDIETVTKYLGEGLTTFEHVVVCFSQDGITRLDTVNGIKIYRIASSMNIASQDIAFSYYHYLKKSFMKSSRTSSCCIVPTLFCITSQFG